MSSLPLILMPASFNCWISVIQCYWIQHDAVSDDAFYMRMKNAGRNEMEDKFFFLFPFLSRYNDRVAGIRSALIASDDINLSLR